MLQIKNKKLIKFIINIANENYNEEVKSIEDFNKYVTKIIKTCNHFTYKNEKVKIENKEIKLK